MVERRSRVLSEITFDKGVAVNFFFCMPEAFRSALDIFYGSRVDKVKTKIKRDLARKEGVIDKKELVRIVVMEWLWLQGAPPNYSFSYGDLMRSRCGRYACQVVECISGCDEAVVKFALYQRFDGKYRHMEVYEVVVSAFVGLLREGFCELIDLDLRDA